MARTARAISSTGVYAVILRTNTDVFAKADMQEVFLKTASDYLGDGLLAIKITDTRVEMLIEESEKGISMDMKPLITSFARAYNREYDHDGKVFVDRFKSVPVEDDDTQNECIEYLTKGGEVAWPYLNVRGDSVMTEKKAKPTPEKKPVTKKTTSAKSDGKKKTVNTVRKATASVKKTVEKTEVKKEPAKKEEAAPIRRRNDLPSWLL